MICPRCSVSEISPVTGKCDLCGYSVVAAVALEPADQLGELATRQLAHEFAFGDIIGRGKESAVYRAKELTSGRAVVLKVILRRNAEADVAESFRTLMATLAGFDHPHLIPVLRHGSTDSLFWFATEDRGAVSLAAKLRADGPMDPKACRRLLTQVVSALDYLHRHGLVHGAVKAENVLVDRDGQGVRLADPNFVRPRWRRPSRAVPVIATPGMPTPGTPVVHDPPGLWVSPEERARGERLPNADQYALAVLTIECLSGAEAESVIDPLALLGPEVPPRMRRAIERALDEIPTRRYPGVTDFLWALEEDAAASMSSPVRRRTSDVVMVKGWEPPEAPRRPFLLAGKILAALLVVAAILLATPQARAVLWPGWRAVRSQASLPPSTVRSPPPAATTAPIAAPRPASPDPIDPRLERREPVGDRVIPPSSIAPRAPAVVAPPRAAAAASVASARLFVNASPWGQVFVDGALIGNTPRPNIPLTAGSHSIRVSRAGFISWERSIRVSSGDTLRFTDIVLTPERP